MCVCVRVCLFGRVCEAVKLTLQIFPSKKYISSLNYILANISPQSIICAITINSFKSITTTETNRPFSPTTLFFLFSQSQDAHAVCGGDTGRVAGGGGGGEGEAVRLRRAVQGPLRRPQQGAPKEEELLQW